MEAEQGTAGGTQGAELAAYFTREGLGRFDRVVVEGDRVRIVANGREMVVEVPSDERAYAIWSAVERAGRHLWR